MTSNLPENRSAFEIFLRYLWRRKAIIFLPIAAMSLYVGFYRYFSPNGFASQGSLTVTQKIKSEPILHRLEEIKREILSSAYLEQLILKHDLFRHERESSVPISELVEKLRKVFERNIDISDDETGEVGSVFLLFSAAERQTAEAVSKDLASSFEAESNFNVIKSFYKPHEYQLKGSSAFLIGAVWGAFFISLPLLFLYEIPNIFYSPRTHKEVFQPLLADWREEYFEAVQQNQKLKACWISACYAWAFLMAMLQRSPLGDLMESLRASAK
jgi:hypothetical protein